MEAAARRGYAAAYLYHPHSIFGLGAHLAYFKTYADGILRLDEVACRP